MRPIKTVLLLQDLHLGGTQRHALELAKRLDPARFGVELWTLMGGGAFLPRALEAGLAVRQLSQAPAVGAGALWGLWRALRRERPHVLMALTVVPNIWGRILGRLAGVPAVIANCRGGGDLWRQHEGLLKNLAVHHICNARALQSALEDRYAIAPGRITVIPTGVDTGHFQPREARGGEGAHAGTPAVIFCLARLSPVKDHETLIKAFEILRARGVRARLVMAGDGELRGELERRVARSPAGKDMDLLPGVADPRPLYARADVVALSSVNEGMPNVLLEAMACGLACVGTAVGGVAEVIRSGRTGFVVAKKDPPALAGALAELVENAVLRSRFGQAGREIAVREHSLEAVAACHAGVIERCARR